MLNCRYSFEDTAFATHFRTVGYLVAIMSVLSAAIMPRAKFIQTMVINIVNFHLSTFTSSFR